MNPQTLFNRFTSPLNWMDQVNAHWGDVKLEDVLDPEPRRTAFERLRD